MLKIKCADIHGGSLYRIARGYAASNICIADPATDEEKLRSSREHSPRRKMHRYRGIDTFDHSPVLLPEGPFVPKGECYDPSERVNKSAREDTTGARVVDSHAPTVEYPLSLFRTGHVVLLKKSE